MNKISKLQEDIDKLQQQQAALEKLYQDLPEDLPDPYIITWHNSSLCEFGLTYHCKTMDEIVGLIEIWQPYLLPLQIQKGTFTSFRTEQHKEEGNVKTRENVFPVKLDISKYGLNFDAYALVGGHLLSLGFDSQYGTEGHFFQYARVTWRTHGNNHGETWVDDVQLLTPGFDSHYSRLIKWASGSNDHPNSFTIYWPVDYTLADIFANENPDAK